jgi:hypothetical protein
LKCNEKVKDSNLGQRELPTRMVDECLCLEWSISKGISKDWQTYVLLTSYVVWTEGLEFSVPLERFPLLNKTQEFLHLALV